jgi:Tol biopolymer transport system component
METLEIDISKWWCIKMYRSLLLTVILLFQLPLFIHANVNDINDLKAAFIREGNLWILSNGEEKQITKSGQVYNPKWSHDGKWVLYQKRVPSEISSEKTQSEIWVYNIETNETIKIFYNGYNPQWAPHRNRVAFQDHKILDISTFKQFYNIALGVSDYAWLPDGSGFLLSSSAALRPDGWTNPILFKKELKDDFDKIKLTGEVETFFTIPKELGEGEQKMISIHANHFEFSPSNKWISFIVSPTASWSMDSNMLCVISFDGKDFQVLDEVIFGVGLPKWAPTKDILAYIAGGGRIVFGFKNKDLKIRELPASASLTPENYAELNFTWKDDQSIITSRVRESEWSNDFSKHPLPSLYLVDIETNKQIKITDPPKGKGDYDPYYIKTINQLVWFRSQSIIGKKDLWVANADGTKAKEWIKNVDTIVFYEK